MVMMMMMMTAIQRDFNLNDDGDGAEVALLHDGDVLKDDEDADDTGNELNRHACGGDD